MTRKKWFARTLLLCVLLGILVLGIPGWFIAARLGAFRSPSIPTAENGLPTSPVSRPEPISQQGYVGSAACQKCHEEISAKYSRHPMGRSAEMLPSRESVEDYSADKAGFAGTPGFRYKAETKNGEVIHHEIAVNAAGETIHKQSSPVSLAIGAAVRGRSYAVEHDGHWLQSPITWYSADGGAFNLSPGYRQQNLHFNRPWTAECLVCHTGRIQFDEQTPTKISFPELTIGCERCHGPGERHVTSQTASTARSPDGTIVNPSRLEFRKRESVCYDCHLTGAFRTPRYGRKEGDFRPGMALEEVACILVDPTALTGTTKSVSQVEQMWSSRCFLGANGKLGCISCHDPHEQPDPENRAAFFRTRCNACHEQQGCSLPLPQRQRQQDSCIACHMPRSTSKNIAHVAHSDHRIPRSPAAKQKSAAPQQQGVLQFFDLADERLPRWEVVRGRALQWLRQPELGVLVQDEFESLLILAQIAPDDAPLFLAAGNHYLNRGHCADAVPWYEMAIQVDPHHDMALASLAYACQMTNNLPAALSNIDRSLKINPWFARGHGLRAEVLAAQEQRAAAAAAARRAIELDAGEAKRLGRLAETTDK
jgi:hypothetical protein